MPSRIHASALKALSLMVSKSAATQLSLTIFESTEQCARTNPGFCWGGSLVDAFLGGCDSVFDCNLEVNRVFCAN